MVPSTIQGYALGCFPVNGSLPVLGSTHLTSPVCELQYAGSASACMCTTDGCNAHPNQLGRTPRNAASREPKNFLFPFGSSSTVGEQSPRQGRQQGLQCYSCGSLFNRESPECPEFDANNKQQIASCGEGEACMLYAWKKSKTEIGSLYEAF